MEDRFNVHSEDFVEFIFGDFCCWLDCVNLVHISSFDVSKLEESQWEGWNGRYHLILIASTSIVHKNVDSSPFRKRVLHQLLPVLFLRYIGPDEMHRMWMRRGCNSFSPNGTM
jgi:hypothetical protein